MPSRYIFQSAHAPGDDLMLTAAIRDLHRAHKGKFVTDVHTEHKEIWYNNPHITPMDAQDKDVHVVKARYPIYNKCRERPIHFLNGYAMHLEDCLHVKIPIRQFKGDVHLWPQEMAEENRKIKGPYWILCAGGKWDFTAKWWDPSSYQAVVSHFKKKINFVRIGRSQDWHPPIEGTTDMIERTSIRELFSLMYHADGVLCPITFAMHLPWQPQQQSSPFFTGRHNLHLTGFFFNS